MPFPQTHTEYSSFQNDPVEEGASYKSYKIYTIFPRTSLTKSTILTTNWNKFLSDILLFKSEFRGDVVYM